MNAANNVLTRNGIKITKNALTGKKNIDAEKSDLYKMYIHRNKCANMGREQESERKKGQNSARMGRMAESGKKKQTKLKMYLVARRTNRHFIPARGKVGQYNLISFVKSTQS